jgi:cytochrome c-type biogenesis protein CcmE
MNLFYIRWVVVILVTLVITFLGFQRYQKDVVSLTPDQLLQHPSQGKIRVIGVIQGGSLTKEEDSNMAFFRLQGEKKPLPVRYRGHDTDTLRDLKIVVVTGRLNAGTGEFEGKPFRSLQITDLWQPPLLGSLTIFPLPDGTKTPFV